MGVGAVIHQKPFSPTYERQLMAKLATSASFFSRFAEYLEEDMFADEISLVVLRACKLFYDETQRGPGGAEIVAQRLKREHSRGRLSMDRFVAAVEWLDDLDVDDGPDEQALGHELAAVVRRRLHAETLDEAHQVYATHGDMADVARKLQAVDGIGVIDLSVGDSLESLSADIQDAGEAQRLSWGCWALDERTGGGRIRGEFGFYLAPPKTGKTNTLVQDSVISVRDSLNCLAVTLELSSHKWRARHLAGITGTPVNDIFENPTTTVAFDRYKKLSQEAASRGKPFGKFLVKKLPAGYTTLADLFSLVDRVEQHWSQRVDVLVVDYMDKMRGNDTRKGMYEQMLDVYEGGRLWAEQNSRWMITASQAKGYVQEGDMPALGDCADSQNKLRVTDWMCGIQKHVDPDNAGKVSLRLLAGRNYEETEILGPYAKGAAYGVFLESVALPSQQGYMP